MKDESCFLYKLKRKKRVVREDSALYLYTVSIFIS